MRVLLSRLRTQVPVKDISTGELCPDPTHFMLDTKAPCLVVLPVPSMRIDLYDTSAVWNV